MPDFSHQAIFPSAELFLIKRFMLDNYQSEPGQWLLGTGIAEPELQSSQTLVSLHQFDIIYRNIFRLARHQDCGLRLGKALNLSRWGLLAMTFVSSPSVGKALQLANQYRSILRSRFDLIPEVIGDMVKVKLKHRQNMPFPVSEVFGFEILLGTLHSQISDLIAQPFHFNRVELHYPAPAYYPAYRQHLDCPVVFACAESCYWMPLEIMEQSLPLTNPIAVKQAREICEQELERVSRIQKGDVSWLIREQLRQKQGPLPSLPAMAAKLAISPRTLRRRLAMAGTSYREIVQQHQLQLALHHLGRNSLTVREVSELCGFKDQTGFREAFKRWTQMTPTEYRKSFGSE